MKNQSKFLDFCCQREVNESMANIPRNALDPLLFQFSPDGSPPALNPAVATQINNDIQSLDRCCPVKDYFIIGSSISYNYTTNCDIDVTVVVDKSKTRYAFWNILDTIKRMNGKMAVGTQHPINYYVVNDGYDYSKTDAAYCVRSEKWLKFPKPINLDIDKYLNQFHDTISSIDILTGELKRDLIDIKELKEIKELNLGDVRKIYDRLKEKFAEVEQDIKHIIQIYSDVKLLRQMAFDRYMTPQEIAQIGSKNEIPENILYKLLEKYYYIDFMKKLEKLLEERDFGKIDSNTVSLLQNILKKV